MQRYIGRQFQGDENSGATDARPTPPPRNPKKQSASSVLIIKDIFALCVANWYWFVISIIIAMAIGVWKIKTTPPVFQRSVSILIKSKESGSENLLKEFGIDNIAANLTNEMELLKTATISREIAGRLNLNVEYYRDGYFHDILLYGEESPVRVNFLDFSENESASFSLSANSDESVTLSNIRVNGQKVGKKMKVPLNKVVKTPLGKIQITPTSSFKSFVNSPIKVEHKNLEGVAGGVRSRIKPNLRNKNTTIIDIKYNDVSKARAEDVLNTLVGVYNENWIKDRNLKTVNTDKFIKDRLAFIEDELGDVEHSISAWKSQNLMLNVDEAGSFAQSQVNEAERDMQELNNQIYMTRYIKDYLNDGQHRNQLLPANSGITNSSIEGLIAEYNSTMLNRNNHVANSSAQNPLVRDLDDQLHNLKGSINQSLDYELTMLQSKANSIRSRQGIAISRVASNPGKAQQLLSVERQQKVKEELYLYLLEKREENELTQAFDAYNNQFIEAPNGSSAPIEPKPQMILLISFGIGLLVPASLIAGREILDTKVRGKKDLKFLSAPYMGDIPLHNPKKHKKLSRKKGEHVNTSFPRDNNTLQPVVIEQKRDIINEAFRMVRSNMEFMLGYDTRNQIVMITSMTPGSGKTFISVNLATVIAIRNRKVLLIDLDLRKGSLSKYVDSPEVGISAYLSGKVQDYHNVIVPMGKVDVIPAGSLPPNPAELLLSSRFQKLMEEVRQEYDFVFLDCPPVEVVADASIVSKYADLTLFVIRVGKMEREFVSDVEDWYHSKKYGNLAVVLNGLDYSGSRYGYQRYGYHKYGYHRHGYEYGE